MSATTPATRKKRLDPDALAALEEERAFLLRSLDDLEAEYAAGDMDTADYEGLKDDYTRRAAEVIRSIEQQEAAFASVETPGWKRVAVWIVGLAILGLLSGLLIARSSGERAEGDEITGGLRQSVVTRLSVAQRMFADPDQWDDAIDLYGEILEESPSNSEALTYRAWLRYRQGAPTEDVLGDWEEVERIDDTYPDRIVFHAIALSDSGRYDEAAAVLDTLDLENAPFIVGSILASRGLRGEVYAETLGDQIQASEDVTLDGLGVDVDVALEMASYLLTTDKPERSVSAIKLLRAVQEVDPTNAAALSREAFLLAQTGDLELFDRAIEMVETALAAHPDDVEALVTHATLVAVRDPDTACAEANQVLTLAAADQTVPAVLVEQATAITTQLAC